MKRSSNSIDGNEIAASSLKELLEKWYVVKPEQLKPKIVLVEKRDTCGCNLGCFYSAPMECARCCSHGVRDLEQMEYEEVEDNGDTTKKITKEQMSELVQLLNLMGDSENERRGNENDYNLGL